MFWPTLATGIGLAMLIGLGTWQLQRLRWKESLVSRIAERVHAAAVPVEPVLVAAAGGADVEYTHVAAHGQFRHDLERYLYAPGDGDWGYDVITPLELGDGRAVLVNRGYVPRQQLDRASRRAGLPAGEVTVTGLIRAAPPGRPWFMPAANPANSTWSWPEISGMVRSMYGTTGKAIDTLTVDADATADASPPAGGATRLELSNRHLEYALTWYALAATLAGIYAYAWYRQQSWRRSGR